ncbi:hypothetical protein LJC19_00550 [Oxalobacter sp. OttesenSCG-928-P03]|nr:hypothetical protein [Oxalobacter sp. OttesenSCG-928-P03]
MKFKTTETPRKNKRPIWFSAIVLSMATLVLAGCARPNEENVKQLLSTTYQCKWLELDSYEKVESLPGIWSYVLRYKFKLNVVNGDEGAKQFIQGMYQTTPGVTDWQKVFENPKAHAYIRENCTLPAQKVMEQIAIQAYIQLNDKSASAVEIPVTVPINGWAEMTPGKGGWNMDMRRDKVDADFTRSSPIPKKVLMSR